MRRALLTVAAPVTPLTVGNGGTLGTTAWGTRLTVDLSGPATRAGTLTTVKAQIPATTTDARVVVGSLVGSNFTLRSVSAALNPTIDGLNIFPVNLAVAAGDFIGYWAYDGSKGLRYGSESGAVLGYSTPPASAPLAGDTIALTTFTGGRAAIYGSGT